MSNTRKMVACGAAALVAVLALACSGQTTQDETTAPASQTSQAPAAAPADQNAAPANGTAPAPSPADQGQKPPQN